jgi:hypothetical protein
MYKEMKNGVDKKRRPGIIPSLLLVLITYVIIFLKMKESKR